MKVDGRVRLHITPFNHSLLDRYIPESLQPQATNISFHTIETFPERGFGYVELPAMEAQKLKKKLNGSVLKGSKVKIEEARPQKKKRKSEEVVPEEAEDEKAARKRARREKKEKPKVGEKVIAGHELEAGRHIKRGWVEDKTKSKKAKKEDGEGVESRKLRFKTVLPGSKSSKRGEKGEAKERKSKEKKTSKEVVVKEFEKSKKPQDGGAKSRKIELTYEEGQGWVDEHGKIVELEPPNKKRRREKDAAKQATKKEKKSKKSAPSPSDAIVREAPELDSEPEDSKIELAHASLPTREEWSGDEDSVSSPSVSSESSPSPDTSENETDPDSDAELDAQLARAKSNTVSNKNTPVPDAALGATPEPTSQPVGEPKSIHPLEALFKRSESKSQTVEDNATKPKPPPIDTSFTFFNSSGAEDEEIDVVAELKAPQTPRTREELEWRRSTRSAAPTPDTAAIKKSFDFSFFENDPRDDEEEDEEMEVGDVVARQGSPVLRAGSSGEGGKVEHDGKEREGGGEESEFRKWFYENRGDLNRSWKKRRREERKVVRQRENRRLGRRL